MSESTDADQLFSALEWALDLCALLDELEKAICDDYQELAFDLIMSRFAIAERHGLRVSAAESQETH